jgi:glucose/arabinose dehydrogenase
LKHGSRRRLLAGAAAAFAIAGITSSAAHAAPGDGRFQKVTLDDHPGEPMGLAVLPDGRVLYTSRDGTVRLHSPKSGLNTIAARVPVYEHDEEGLQSVALDPRFKKTKWVYLYYSPPQRTPVDDPATPDVNEGDAPLTGTAADFARFKGVVRLSRFKLRGDRLRLGSEQRIIDVPVDRGLCCHVGGHIDFDAKGNLYLSTGDDTYPFASGGYTPLDERPEANPGQDAQRSAGNTNDLRGKLLRIRPRAGKGGYTVPKGNLFGRKERRTRPEIYAMGLRNPFRFAVDRRTSAVYLGDYSPDSTTADPARGPAGTGRWTVIRRPANYGWPYCATPRLPYVDFDFATQASGSVFDCARPVNESPHNTGKRVLPRVAQPTVWYGFAASAEFPALGTGGVGPMGGPAYDPRKAGKSRTRWPRRYAGVPIMYEWTRDYAQAFFLRSDGRGVRRMEQILTGTVLDNPMDMEFGRDGALYVLEYGDGYFNENPEAQLSRIDFTRGNRSPVPAATADPVDGAVPLTVRFSAAGSIDPDGDDLRYQWHFDEDGKVDSRERDPVHTFDRAEIADVTLRVIDATGRAASTSVQVLPGLARPKVTLQVSPPAGQPFQFGQTVSYAVTVEDGGRPIACSRVSVTYSLGHDQHAHAQTTAVGCKGTIAVNTDDSHKGAANLTGVFSAEYVTEPRSDGEPLIGSTQVVLVPGQ